MKWLPNLQNLKWSKVKWEKITFLKIEVKWSENFFELSEWSKVKWISQKNDHFTLKWEKCEVEVKWFWTLMPTIVLSKQDRIALCSVCQFAFCNLCFRSSHFPAPCPVNSREAKRIISDYEAAEKAGNNKKIQEIVAKYGKNITTIIEQHKVCFKKIFIIIFFIFLVK